MLLNGIKTGKVRLLKDPEKNAFYVGSWTNTAFAFLGHLFVTQLDWLLAFLQDPAQQKSSNNGTLVEKFNDVIRFYENGLLKDADLEQYQFRQFLEIGIQDLQNALVAYKQFLSNYANSPQELIFTYNNKQLTLNFVEGASILMTKGSQGYYSYEPFSDLLVESVSLAALASLLVRTIELRRNFLKDVLLDESVSRIYTSSHKLKKHGSYITLEARATSYIFFKISLEELLELIDTWVEITHRDPAPVEVHLTRKQGKISLSTR